MAYENYNFISWSDGTPVSSNRLSQMSTNIEQVKEVVDDKAQGLLKFNQIQTQFPNSTGYADFAEYEIIALKDESGSGGADRRVTIAENRYYRVGVNIPSIAVLGRGAEDSKYIINIYQGVSKDDPNSIKIGSWEITPHPFAYIDVSAVANSNTMSVKTNTYPSKVASGLFSVIQTTTTAITNESFVVSIARNVGSSANNAPRWRVEGNSSSPIQFFVEDIGGI